MKHSILPYIYVASCSILFMLNSYITYAHKNSTFYETGKKYFRTHCSSCHSPHQEVYGPMLGSITKKKTESWLIKFIQNSQEVIKSGDPYATELLKKFNYQTMPSFEYLSEEKIKSILNYLEIESIQTIEYINDLEIPLTSDNSILLGKQEFLDHCSICHFIHKESSFAPALGSVTKRHSRDWLTSFIKNSQKKISSGDIYAQNIYNAFDQHVMTSMEFLKIEEINSILDFIEFASTEDVAYKGKINKIEYKKQAIDQIEKSYIKYPIASWAYLTVIFLILLSMIYLVFMSYRLIVIMNK